MKFIAPRSASPSPERTVVRPQPYNRNVFGLRDADLLDLCDSSSDEDDLDFIVAPKSNTKSRLPWAAENATSSDDEDSEYIPNPYNLPRSPEQQNELNASFSSIRRRTKYEDPYEQWQESLRAQAREDVERKRTALQASLEAQRLQSLKQQLANQRQAQKVQMDKLRMMFEKVKIEKEKETDRLKKEFIKRERELWSKVEKAIQDEERKLEEQRKEIERRQEEERQRLEREKKAMERKEAEEKERKIKEQLELQKKQKEEQERKQKLAAEDEARRREDAQKEDMKQLGHDLGMKTAGEEWEEAKNCLAMLKKTVHPAIKADRDLKNLRNKLRRMIVPKVGQLTSDERQIERVTKELKEILLPNPPHPPTLYKALLGALSKAFLLQAETEITARSTTALPLAKVLVNLLSSVPDLHNFFFARLVQRIGVWAVPISYSGPPPMTPEEKEEHNGRWGISKEDGNDPDKNATRIGGVMTLYFAVMHTPHREPLPERFALSRYWRYMARLLNSRDLCRSNVALEIVRVALAVAGDQALRVWGRQWAKVLEVIINRLEGPENIAMGTRDVVATAKRIRILEEIRKVADF